jgi:hypothetical protein
MCANHALKSSLGPGHELLLGGHSLGWGLTQKQIQSKVIDAGGFPVKCERRMYGSVPWAIQSGQAGDDLPA